MENKKMTLNERLIHHGELKNFDKALRNKNKEELLAVLKSVGLENYEMKDVDFIIQHTKLEKLSFVQKIKKLFF
jgi:hypothetical protein